MTSWWFEATNRLKSSRVWLAILAVCALLIAAPLNARADGVSIEANFSPSTTAVSIQGRLLNGGTGIGPHRLSVSLDDVEVQRIRTSTDGTFSTSVDLPAGLTGQHIVSIYFDGAGKFAAANQSFAFDPSAIQAVPPQKAETSLEVSGPVKAFNGTVVTITGKLATTSGVGIASAGINVSDALGEVSDSFAITGTDGSFSTLYVVAEDQPVGPLLLTFDFAGSTNLEAASAPLNLDVARLEMTTASPTATPTTASPSPTPSPTPTPRSSATMPSRVPTESASPAPSNRSILSTVAIATVAVGGLGAIALVVLVYHGAVTRRRHDAEPGHSFFDDRDSTD